MVSLRVFALLARFLTVMVCWIILMGVPLLVFERPLTLANLMPFLGVFYALLLLTGTVVARSWGGKGVVFLAFPFLLLFTIFGLQTFVEAASPLGLEPPGGLAFFAIYGVVWLAWRLGARWRSPARESGRLLD
jgi:hypothetical protein